MIDGKSLDFALDESLKGQFLDLAVNCSSVICCRSSPKQKARVSGMIEWFNLVRAHSLFVVLVVNLWNFRG